MQIITNTKRPKHLNAINRLLDTSEEIIVCVAFLKKSGLSLIINKLPDNCTFYIGTDYYLTEPAAIKQLIDKGHTVFIINKRASTFHPKIYYFRQEKKISILTGSANLTSGGFDTNFEASILLQTTKGSSIERSFNLMIKSYLKNSTQILSEMQISQYERDYETYRKKHKKADKEFRDEMKGVHKIDLKLLDKHFKEYLREVGTKAFKKRITDYNKIRGLLDDLIKAKIYSANSFLDYYEEIANSFYSSDLLRGKTVFAKGYKKIISAIKFIKNNKTKEPHFVYSKARSLILSVDRFGVNGLTEIMNAYNLTEFSVANGRTIKSLANLGFAEFPKTDKKYFDENVYSKYNNLIKEIAVTCKANELGQVDHFLSWYYDKYVKKHSS